MIARDFGLSLRWKLLAFALVVSASFVLAVWVLGRTIVQPQFARIEAQEADDDLARVEEAIARDAEVLARYAQDYGAWDDTLDFVATRDPAYVAANLVPETLVNLGVDLLMYRSAAGETFWAKRLDPESGELADDAALFAALQLPALRLFEHRTPTSRKSGIVMTPRGPALVGSAAITDSQRRAPPSGTVLYGRLLSTEVMKSIAERTRVAFTLAALGSAVALPDRAAATALASGAGTWHDRSSERTLVAYARVRDVRGAPLLLLRAELPRDTSLQAHAAARLTTLASGVAGVVLLAVMWCVLARFVVQPIERLTTHAVRVGATDDLGARLALPANDEIGVLAREFDGMVARLEASRAQLLDVARDAGRAEVARSVLHDLGNVLTSVGVSSSVAADCVARFDVASLRRVADLLRGNEHRMPEFFTSDPRAPHLLPFLDALASTLEKEREHALGELRTLDDAIDHMMALVSTQNLTAQNSAAVTELLDPAMIAAKAAAFATDSSAGSGITLVRDFAAGERVPLDRHRCLQVLANLLENAKHAVNDGRSRAGSIRLSVSRSSDAEGDWVCFAVSDDGVGIAPDQLVRIFALGYSTRPGGQGIGLHSAANLAREMGGSLQAESAGQGLGATFTLRVPAARRTS